MSDLDFNLVTTDTQPYAAGLYRGKAGYLVPKAHNDNFISEILKICSREHVDCILIGTDYELMKFAQNKEKIETESKAKVVVSSPEQIRLTDDKWLTAKFFADNDLPHIPTVLAEHYQTLLGQEDFPFIIKPRIGDSSKDIAVVRSKQELDDRLDYIHKNKPDNVYLSENPGFILQKYLADEKQEFTSTTVTFNNRCYGVLSMNREMKYPGHTTKAIIKDFPEINSSIKKIAELFNAFGPANFQSRMLNGKPYIFEINCRFSGTTPFCARLGFNTVAAAVKKIVLHQEIDDLKHQNGVMLRYFNEIFIPQEQIDEMIAKGSLQNPSSIIVEVL